MEATDVGLKAFEKYEKFYTNFKRPRFAKVYHPTSEEFADPIAYVAQIKQEAEEYGVVKIVPPKDFKPSFAIDKGTFTFTPRIQKLSEIEAIVRERNAFTERITHYWELQGTIFRPPTLEGRPVDLFKAHVLIRCEGGFTAVSVNKRWTAIAKALGLKSNQAGSKLKDHYSKYVIPFAENIEKGDFANEDIEEEDKKEDTNRGLGEGRSSMQGGIRQPKMKRDKKKMGSKEEKEVVVCNRCLRGDSEDKLMRCENCRKFLHMFCARPPVKERTKSGWHCPSCIESRVRRMGEDEGFSDSATSYTLTTFTSFANDYKEKVFGKQSSEVSIDEMENAYWKNMLDGELDLQVKYGADLMVSKVGSGFCRKTDANLSVKDKQMANHPWNLNNMPVVKDSVLSHIDSSISGMMVPWVYVGMAFSTFCWHTEDHWTYSVNYNHWGDNKIWYGVSAYQATKFEEVVQSICPALFRLHPDLLHHMTVAVNPNLLASRGVDVYTVHQEPGEFVITFPRAYHAGFNAGLNFAEAVNFAPIDWLSMGRDCMLSYGQVRRNCVFAHDELVMKITRACHRLSTNMAHAALDELRVMYTREREGRESARIQGVKMMEKMRFEDITEDDERMCTYCNTTLFMSGVRCNHGKRVCLDHIEYLCRDCPLDKAILLYSFEVDELVPMMESLEERMKMVQEWEKKANDMKEDMDKGNKIDVHSLECLLEDARGKHYPLNGIYAQLNSIMIECRKTMNKARNILSEGKRVRSTTRNQRADPRCDVMGGKEILNELTLLPVIDMDLCAEIEEVLIRVEDWERRVDILLEGEDNEKEVDKLIDEGDRLTTIRIDRLALLKEKERRRKWMNGTMKEFLKWSVNDCNEMSMEWKDKKRWTFNEVHEMIEEGRRVGMAKSSKVREMESRRDEGVMMDLMSRQTMERNCTKEGKTEVIAVKETWNKAREIDWLNAPGINALRDEIYHIVNINSYERAKEYSLFDYVQWIDHLECSKTVKSSDLTQIPRTQVKKMKEWTDGLRKLFELEHSYHSLYEIVVCRENVLALSLGQTPTLRREDTTHSIELWKPVHMYESSEVMEESLTEVSLGFPSLIDKLRSTHESLPPSHSCPCLSEKEKDHPILRCILCKAATHLSCGWWCEYLARLPPGSFLCVRCMRGRRPLISDVHTIMQSANNQWMEARLLQISIKQFEETAVQVRKVHTLWKEDRNNTEIKKKLSSLLITLLSLEMTDSSLLAQLTESISILFRETLESQRDAWDALRARAPSILCGETLFKQRLSLSPLRKKKRKDKEEGKEVRCAHRECVFPHTTQLEWVKCQLCKRWYHVICTGKIIDPDLSDYKCC